MSEPQYEEDDIRGDFEDAFKQLEGDDVEDEDFEEVDDDEDALEETEDSAEDEVDLDDEDSSESDENDDESTFEETEDTADEQDAEAVERDSEPDEDVGPAPAGWRALARESWKDVPKTAREEILKREQETSAALTKSTQARELQDRFNQVAQPFERHILREGTDAMGAFQGLLQTAATLQEGTPSQKAQTIAQMIGRYGVDIETLDEVLASGGGQQVNQEAIEAATRPYREQLARMQQQDNQSREQEIESIRRELDEFSSNNEFYEDVKDRMADLMGAAASSGRELSLADAYEQACKLDDSVQTVLTRRQEVEEANKRKAAAKKKKRAASSIRSRSGGTNRRRKAESDNPHDDLRADLEAAMNQQD